MAAAGIQGAVPPRLPDFPADSRPPTPYESGRTRLVLCLRRLRPQPARVRTRLHSAVGAWWDFAGAKIILAHGGYGSGTVLDLLGERVLFRHRLRARKHEGARRRRELYRQNEDFFGTDSPWRDQKHYVELIRTSETLTADQKEKLFSGNIRKLIRIGGNP